ncbi:hypothetical protein SLEP1_g28161 [Rubroshorea leprosula]|uniref:Uncharacterized protein n=1 Tax=Rubroshorea leprosula TaxID=152421 RepID=A0AAV5K258_9ROSI|nr:hypothetical protein SLEP1_g28161 [Rubroshorea leprosula]
MEDMRDSTAVPQIVKIVRMVVKFHPLLTITSLIFKVAFLQDWIEEEVSNQWKILKVYCQSIMTALLDPVIEKMKNLSEALQMYFNNEVAKGQLKATLVGKLALFSATFLLLDTELGSKYDEKGVKTQLLLLAGVHILDNPKLWRELRILRGSCDCTTNSTSNFTFFILALLFARFCVNSLRSLSSMLCIAVYFLCVLVVVRPRTDFGFFNFIIGVIGSITYNLYKLKFPTWIIASTCFVLLSSKSWMDKYWLNLEEDPSTNTIAGSTSVFVIFTSIVVRPALAIFTCSVVKSPMSDYKSWLIKLISVVIWFARFYKFYPNPNSSLPSTNNKGISGLILIVVNVAQGIFAYVVLTCPLADYKDWSFAVISYVVFCFWIRSFFPKDLLPSSTNTKGITGMIWSLLSVTKYGIEVLAGLEPRVHYREWVIAVTCYVLWWVQLRTPFLKDPLQSTTVEFKFLPWWTMAVFSMIQDVVPWIQGGI